jgi:hypothetical protein
MARVGNEHEQILLDLIEETCDHPRIRTMIKELAEDAAECEVGQYEVPVAPFSLSLLSSY